jgi:hypothetical protein
MFYYTRHFGVTHTTATVITRYLPPASDGFLLGLLFNPEDGSETSGFLYTKRRYNPEVMSLFTEFISGHC